MSKHRIRIDTYGDGKKYYYPQWKGWMLYNNFTYTSGTKCGRTVGFESLEEAEDFLKVHNKRSLSNKLINVEYL